MPPLNNWLGLIGTYDYDLRTDYAAVIGSDDGVSQSHFVYWCKLILVIGPWSLYQNRTIFIPENEAEMSLQNSGHFAAASKCWPQESAHVAHTKLHRI